MDGPQPRRVIVATAATVVPPGFAYRTHSRTVRHRVAPEYEAAKGAQWAVIKNISRMIGTGSLIQFERDGEPWLQLSTKARRILGPQEIA